MMSGMKRPTQNELTHCYMVPHLKVFNDAGTHEEGLSDSILVRGSVLTIGAESAVAQRECRMLRSAAMPAAA